MRRQQHKNGIWRRLLQDFEQAIGGGYIQSLRPLDYVDPLPADRRREVQRVLEDPRRAAVPVPELPYLRLITRRRNERYLRLCPLYCAPARVAFAAGIVRFIMWVPACSGFGEGQRESGLSDSLRPRKQVGARELIGSQRLLQRPNGGLVSK